MRAANISMLRAGFWALSPIEQVYVKPSARVVGSSASPVDPRCMRLTHSRAFCDRHWASDAHPTSRDAPPGFRLSQALAGTRNELCGILVRRRTIYLNED